MSYTAGRRLVVVENIIPFIFRLYITCPACRGKARVEYSRESKLWFPIPLNIDDGGGYCCDVMRECDSELWNIMLDKEIEKAKVERRKELSKVVIG